MLYDFVEFVVKLRSGFSVRAVLTLHKHSVEVNYKPIYDIV